MDESKFLSQTPEQSETLGVWSAILESPNPRWYFRLKLGHVTRKKRILWVNTGLLVANLKIRTRNTILTEKEE